MRLVYYPIAIALAIFAISYSVDATRLTRIASAQLDMDHATDLAWKSIVETLTFSLYSGASETKSRVSDLYLEAARRQVLAERCSLAFAIIGLIYLSLRYMRAPRDDSSSKLQVTSDLLGIGVICLVVGLLAPILILKAYTSLPVVGEVVLKFEAKSVITTIGSLAKANNYFIALLIAGFSVITPLIKIIIAILVVQRRWPRWHMHGLNFIKAIGKWSMADVFVVAVLVAYFAASGDEFSEADIGLGLYYFTAYCFLSQFATHRLMQTFGDEIASATESYAPVEPELRSDRKK